MFKGVGSSAELAGPWFAASVMGAIQTRERELALPASLWSAVPRYASRLAWVTAFVLLAGSTWLDERRVAAPNKPTAAASSQEYLFEAPAPPMNQDDVLISMAEKNQSAACRQPVRRLFALAACSFCAQRSGESSAT